MKAGGLGLGTTVTSAAFLTIILGLVLYLTFRPQPSGAARPTAA